MEAAHGQSALMFAAALGRTDAVKALLARGADVKLTSAVVDLSGVTCPRRRCRSDPRGPECPQRRSQQRGAMPAPPPRPRGGSRQVAGVTRPFNYNELIGKHGGLSALHFAARQGATDTVQALVEGGADVNQRSAGDHTTPMLIAAVNGHYDLVLYLLGQGRRSRTSPATPGMAPLYAVLNVEWAPKIVLPAAAGLSAAAGRATSS